MIPTHTCQKRRRRARKARKKRTRKKIENGKKVERTRSTVKDLEVSLLSKRFKPLLVLWNHVIHFIYGIKLTFNLTWLN